MNTQTTQAPKEYSLSLSSHTVTLNSFHRYAQLCQNLLEENVESGEQFSQEFLPSLLFLLSDPVPNVRLSLARTLSQGVLLSGTFHFKHSISFGKFSLSPLQRLPRGQGGFFSTESKLPTSCRGEES